MRAPLTWRPRCTSRTISGRTSTRPATTARPGRRSSTAFPATHFTRVIREDPNRKGLLVAGTEFGLYISYRRRRELEAVPAQSAGHADHRPGVPQAREGTGGRDAGPRVLGARRCAAALPVERTASRPRTPTCSSRRTRTASAAADAAVAAGAGGAGGRRESAGRRGGLLLAEGPAAGRCDAGVSGYRRASWSTSSPARGRRRPRRPPAEDEENPFRGAPPARVPAQAGHESLRVEPALSGRDHVSRADHVGRQRDRTARRRRASTRCA